MRVQELLLKPYDLDDLLDRVRRALEEPRRGAELPPESAAPQPG